MRRIVQKIALAKDTIDKHDIDQLIDWLKTYPRLTKGELTLKFEDKFSKWHGSKYSVFVNSGSSANLLMLYALKLCKRLKNNRVIVPAVAWATTVAPLIQLGFEPIICDISLETLNVDIQSLYNLVEKYNPAVFLGVHVLGFPFDVEYVKELCKHKDMVFLEDSCEALGSETRGKKVGNFGLMSTFSFYFGHQCSCIEGGIICTNDKELYDMLLMIRSHGWDRDLGDSSKNRLRKKHDVSDFKSLYTFYVPGFNFRATDLQAFIGLNQLKKLPGFAKSRNKNLWIYQSKLRNPFWKPKHLDPSYMVSNFAYPIIHPKRDEIIKKLNEAGVENRPLVCGSIGQQPFVKKYCKYIYDDVAREYVDKYGFYVPNHHSLTEDEIGFVCDIINNVIGE
jgi:CDP-6-deoxy-D-xylo-4-hexulose-3-dehydrase